MKRTKKTEPIMSQERMVEELEDIFNLPKQKAAELLTLAVKIPMMLKMVKSFKAAYEAFVIGYEAEDDKTFKSWKAYMKQLIIDYDVMKAEVDKWESKKEMAKFNKAFADLAQLVKTLS